MKCTEHLSRTAGSEGVSSADIGGGGGGGGEEEVPQEDGHDEP